MIDVYYTKDKHKQGGRLFGISEQELRLIESMPEGRISSIDPYGDTRLKAIHIEFITQYFFAKLKVKEQQHCHDGDYALLKRLYDKFKSIILNNDGITCYGD